MRDPGDTFVLEKNKLQNRPVFLYTVFDYDGANNNLYYAGYDADVVFDGVTYLKFPITHDQIGENTAAEIDQVKITVSNVTRSIQQYLESYDLRGKRVSIKQVFIDHLTDATCFLEDFFYIDSYSADVQSAQFTCTGKFDVLQLRIPARKFWRNYCPWRFKGTECAYAGAETTCNKTFARCEELANKSRFGGFPSIPSHRIFIG